MRDSLPSGEQAGRDGVVEVWEARAEYAVGVLIRRYLAEHPPPGRSAIASDLQHWAHALAGDGRERLQALGQDHLSLVEPA